jgi:hypothetical protein
MASTAFNSRLMKGLFELFGVATDVRLGGLELDHEFDAAVFDLMFDEAQRVLQRLVDIDLAEYGMHRPGQPHQLCGQRIDPIHLLHHQAHHLVTSCCFSSSNFGKRLDRHQRVLDFVGDPRRHHAQTGQPLQALDLELELARGGQVMKVSSTPSASPDPPRTGMALASSTVRDFPSPCRTRARSTMIPAPWNTSSMI